MYSATLLCGLLLCDVSPASLDEIKREWQARETLVDSGRFAWADERHHFPSAPDDEVTTIRSRERRFVFSSHMYRYDMPEISARVAGGAKPRMHFSMTDGDISMDFETETHFGYPRAIIHHSSQFDNFNNVNTRPVLMTYRAAHFLEDGVVTIDPNRVSIRGHSCICLHLREGERLRYKYYIDPQFAFVVRRVEAANPKYTAVELECDYALDEELAVPVPTAWTYRWLAPNGRVTKTAMANVIHYELNSPIDASEFRMPVDDLPHGTWVKDRRESSDYLMIRGSKRYITDEERGRGITYEDLLKSSSGRAGLDAAKSRSAWNIVVGICVMCALAAGLWRIARGS